ncbi:hypothetical protein D3C78_609050 [compost metagenome]
MAAEELPALVAGTVEGHVAGLDVLLERLEERRVELLLVGFGRLGDALAVEVALALAHLQRAGNAGQDVFRHRLTRLQGDEQRNRETGTGDLRQHLPRVVRRHYHRGHVGEIGVGHIDHFVVEDEAVEQRRRAGDLERAHADLRAEASCGNHLNLATGGGFASAVRQTSAHRLFGLPHPRDLQFLSCAPPFQPCPGH